MELAPDVLPTQPGSNDVIESMPPRSFPTEVHAGVQFASAGEQGDRPLQAQV
jgi:hypothetical protein